MKNIVLMKYQNTFQVYIKGEKKMKKVLKYIKNFIIVTITMLAFIIAVGEPDDFTNKILILKLICVFWIGLVAYANN